MDEASEQSNEETLFDALEGAVTLLELLVLQLSRSGALDQAEFARTLLQFRRDQVEPDSMRAVLVDRMLGMLTGNQSDTLIRRSAFHLVKRPDSPGRAPNPPTEGPDKGNGT